MKPSSPKLIKQRRTDMGTGSGAGLNFGGTHGAKQSSIFKRVNFTGTVKVNGQERDVSRRVYQRSDIDFEFYDIKTKKTNLARMLNGDAPIGNDGKPVQLHHILQQESGPMVEIREITHQEYKRTLHGLVSKGNSFRQNSELRKQYNNFRSYYWKWRAQQYIKGSK